MYKPVLGMLKSDYFLKSLCNVSHFSVLTNISAAFNTAATATNAFFATVNQMFGGPS